MTDREIQHGTKNAYSYRKCRCADCRAAWATYKRERYQKDPENRAKTVANQAARTRAYARLAAMNPALWRSLLDEELGR